MGDMYAVPGETLFAIADAIRLKRDTTTPMSVEDMPMEISLIESGGATYAGTLLEEAGYNGAISGFHIPAPSSGSGIVFIFFRNGVAPQDVNTSGTCIALILRISNSIISRFAMLYRSGRWAFRDVLPAATERAAEGTNYFVIQDGLIEPVSTNSTWRVGAGAEVFYTIFEA